MSSSPITSESDVRQVVEGIVGDPARRSIVLSLLADSIEEADRYGRHTWGYAASRTPCA